MKRVEAPPALAGRHIAAVTLGNALEFYDFLTYAFFAIQIGHAFFPGRSAYVSLMASLAAQFAGFAMRPVGGFIIGLYADRVGRRPAMLLSFLLMGVSIFAMALIPPYAAIGVAAPALAVLARMAQGFSLGGEIGSNTAFLMEAAPPDARGRAVAWQGASQCVALLLGSIVGVVLTAVLSAQQLDSYGWRIAFLLGTLTVPFGLWLRTRLPETMHACAAVEARATQFRTRLAWRHARIMVLGLVILGSASIANYIAIYIVTFAQATLNMSARAGFLAETANNLIAIPAVLLGGILSDRFGRRPINIGNNLVMLLLVWPVFAWMVGARSPLSLILGMTILGILANFSFGSFLAALTESLPESIRVSGFGTVYSLAISALGGSTSVVVTWLIHVTGSAMAPAWYWLGATVIGQLALMLFPESAPGRAAAQPGQRTLVPD